MLWGKRWGLYWGYWIEKVERQTVQVRKIMGKFLPCVNCKWYNNCVVPRRDFKVGISSHANVRSRQRSPKATNIYICEDFTAKSR